jgi:hypothetical protein
VHRGQVDHTVGPKRLEHPTHGIPIGDVGFGNAGLTHVLAPRRYTSTTVEDEHRSSCRGEQLAGQLITDKS